ncbi:MerR family transcriptional regulator [Trinickia caryophylli]|uniref:Transcriptional regulator, MerR family n=1 Tax=Trinickia caryophylli TaxID=28094 RepID=A0A1X7GUQ0_TRICW|nr:MerR family transcriptional regulator [Trinickia caryophylli]WQE11103.1 MerR family transcriptional regulator [Trinickia caryophylli]GLU35260.1 hypothetical protein Busp01_51020 [Trinickia caryophylli]SMF74838.1 transcriptional regulator, MerR family [Trinickia caryophylli]
MNATGRKLNAGSAAKLLGVSVKTLRIYEKAGLLAPSRNESGYRQFGKSDLDRAAHIVLMRRTGFTLAEISQCMGYPEAEAETTLSAALTDKVVERTRQIKTLFLQLDYIRFLRTVPTPPLEGEDRALEPERVSETRSVSFPLSSPWDGQIFSMPDIRRLNYIVGPVGSGKTQLALQLGWALPSGVFINFNKVQRVARSAADPLNFRKTEGPLQMRIDEALADLADGGATLSDALHTLVHSIEDTLLSGPSEFLIVDRVEEDLDLPTQKAVGAYLRRRAAEARSGAIFAVTRSAAIVDLATAGDEQSVILCPPNRSLPISVPLRSDAYGYETLVMCLESRDG